MKKTIEINEPSALSMFETLFKHHNQAVCMINSDGCIQNINRATSELLGYSKEELLSLPFQSLVSPNELDSLLYYFQQTFAMETHEINLSIHSKYGEVIDTKITLVPIEVDGQVELIILYLKTNNISQKITITSFRQDLCESFIENNRDPILLLDLDATIVLANQTFSNLLGWRKENLEGFHILQCPSIPPHLVNQMREFFERVVSAQNNANSLDENEVSTLETIRVSTDNQPYVMLLSITPIRDNDNQICNWAVHLRDITSQKQAENSLRKAEKLLTVGQIAAGITHEIRNPLQSLKGMTQLIKSSNESSRDQEKYLEIMTSELTQIETFVDEFSLLARTKMNSFEQVSILQIVDDVIDSLHTLSMLYGVQIEMDEIELPSIWCDEKLLKQAIFNVMQNGIESMRSGGTLHIVFNQVNEFIEITVKDNGIGIPLERCEKLGEPYYTNKEKGFGLGLMLTYKIIEQHQGKINIQSKEGQGTQVTITLPLSL